ncbi:hypothetical protein [Actinocorallia populi]|uniref:hypothetical protein n=1 Tax=Actinocorallia populi TaxID=2079200 RepID=UPI001E395A88|nr:hypothetical protein [Actinocorallia populi]
MTRTEPSRRVEPTRYAARTPPVRREPFWGGAVRGAFGAASRLRGGHVFHNAGNIYVATLTIDRGDFLRGETEHRTYEAVARFSRALALPGGLPDILGIALHIPTGEGMIDLLFATTGRRPGMRHVLLPRRSFTSGAYTTLLPYSIKGRTALLGLFPQGHRRIPARLGPLDEAIAAAPLSFRLASASLLGRWRPHGTLRVHTPWAGEDLGAFDPELHNVPELHPTGPFQTFRRKAYQGSRRVRGE